MQSVKPVKWKKVNKQPLEVSLEKKVGVENVSTNFKWWNSGGGGSGLRMLQSGEVLC